MIEVKIFECEYCHKKRLKTKRLMQNHEDVCYCNPKNKACITCVHFALSSYICLYDESSLAKWTQTSENGWDIDKVNLRYRCNNWKQKPIKRLDNSRKFNRIKNK